MSLGAAIGAITFSGSIIAFLKLRGIMSGSPITFKGQHFINLLLGSTILFNILFVYSQSSNIFWSIVLLSFIVGVLLIIPIGGADMRYYINAELLFWLGCSRNRIYFRKYSFNNYRCLGWFFRCDLVIIMCKGE